MRVATYGCNPPGRRGATEPLRSGDVRQNTRGQLSSALAVPQWERVRPSKPPRAVGIDSAARAIAKTLNADSSDHVGPVRVRPARSLRQTLRLEQAYYHCPHRYSGFSPRDRHLGIEK